MGIALDINTLLIATVLNIAVLAILSPAVMGLRLSPAANAARWSLVVHALAWVCMITSNLWPETLADRVLSTFAIAGYNCTNLLLFVALSHWLGPRHFTRTNRFVTYITPVVYFLIFEHYAWRVGWANFLIALQTFFLTLACFRPKNKLRGNWRFVVAFGMFAMTVLTLGRGILGAFTDLYPAFLTPSPWNIAAMLMTSLLPVLVNYAVLGGWHEEAEIAIRQQAITDSLTSLYNRRGWTEVGQPLVANANRHEQAVALLMFDIDHFKKINDEHGHDMGDRVLQALGNLLLANRRENDVAARVGGEEFCLLLPSCSADSAEAIDRRLREKLPEITQQFGFPVGYSCGLSMLRPGETLERMMMRADTALYTAKANGRGHLQRAA